MTVYLVNNKEVGGFYASPALSIKKKDEELSMKVKDTAAQKDGDVLMEHNGNSALFQHNTFLDWDLILQAAKTGDNLMTSIDSSLCLTEAPHITSSPTFFASSAVPASQSANALLQPFGNGVRKNSYLNKTEFSGVVSDKPLDSIFFSSSENDFFESGIGLKSLGQKEPFRHISNDNDKMISRLHGAFYAEKDGICELKTISLDGTNGHVEGHSQDEHGAVKAASTIPPSSAELVVNEKPDFITGENDKEVISVVDPQRAKLHVPLSAVFPTKALGARAQHPSLCLLFQSGCCRQGANCHQVHVSPDVVKQLREVLASFPCCCLFHGDCNAKQWNAKGYVKDEIVVDNVLIPFSRLAFTSGLSRFVANAMRHPLSCDVLCRLHGKPGGCRYGADCWYLHVCREILAKEFPSVVQSSVAGTLTEAESSTPPQLAQKKDAICLRQSRSPHTQELKKQQNLRASAFQSPLVSVNNLPVVKDNMNSSGVVQSDQPVFFAVPCMWTDNLSPAVPKMDPTPLGVTVGGCGGVLPGGVMHGNFASDVTTGGVVPLPCHVPHDHSMPFLPGHFPNQNTVFVPVEKTTAKPHHVPFFPPYYVVKQTSVSEATTFGAGFSVPVEQPQLWLPPPQQGQQTYLFPQNCGTAGSPAFVVPRSLY